MSIVYLDSAYAGSQGAASGDLGHGAGNIWTRPDQYWPSAANGDNVYFRDDRVWVPHLGKIFTTSGINNKRLIIGRYGGGAEIPFIDGSFYEDTVSGWVYIGGGVWQKTINVGGGWSAPNSQSMWTGALRPTTDKAAWHRGVMHAKATGNYASGFVNGNNPLNGNGIWYTYTSGSDFIAQVWTGNSGPSGDPVSVYGGLRFLDGNGATGCAMLGLVFIGASASDSEVHEIACFGFRKAAMGSCDHGVDGTVDGLLFDSVHMLGSKRGIYLQSLVADTFVRNVELSGEWVQDDYVDTATSPSRGDVDIEDHNNWEGVSASERVQDFNVSNGVCLQGAGHGALSLGDGDLGNDGSQLRPARITINGTRVRINRLARNARGLSIQCTDDMRVTRVKITGQGVATKALGNRTVVSQCEWSECGAALGAQNNGTSIVSVPANVSNGTINVTFVNNWLDGRGRNDYGATQAFSVFEFKATDGNPLPAGSVVLDCNVLIGDSGCAAVRVVNGPTAGAGNEVSANQTLRSNWWNTGASAVECYNRVGSESVAGTVTTIVGQFSTGTVSGNSQKTLALLSSGGNRPMTRQGVLQVDKMPFN